jgi:hypothetical protein
MFSIGQKRSVQNKKGPRDANGRRIKKSTKVMKATMPVIPFRLNRNHKKFYKGPHWTIPNTIQVSDSVANKFPMVSNIFNYTKLKERIDYEIKNLKFKIPSSKDDFKMPFLTSIIQSYYAKQENDWNKVRGIYFRLFKFKEIMKPLIFRWKIRKCLKQVKNTEDPVTLEIPKKPVYIIDIKKRISFVYEANTIRRSIENRILCSDYMFAEPQVPINLLCNLPLTYGQLISVIIQCKAYGEYSWVLEALRSVNGCMIKFAIFNKTRLNIEAIKAFFKKSVSGVRDTVLDFFRAEAEFTDMPVFYINKFTNMCYTNQHHPKVRQWVNHTRDYYIAKEINNPALILTTAIRTEVLLNSLYLEI